MCSKALLCVSVVMCSVILCLIVVIGWMTLNNDLAPPCGMEASVNLIHHSPWLVHLEYWKQGAVRRVRCAGSLVARRHVVTAAHCVTTDMFDSLTVRLGEYDMDSTIDCVAGVCADQVTRISVASVYVPKDYNGKEFDIAVLVLKEEAPYTDFIRPICLPSAPTTDDVILSAAGWGEITKTHVYSRIKKIIPLPAWSKEKCLEVYKELPHNVICAGGEEGIDTCRGDSGGPLTLNRGRVELVGVTSLGNVNCGTEGSPGIYTSVIEYKSFIEDIIRTTS